MTYQILVIGGAGFIGSHLVDELLNANHEITVYDSLEPQVHGNIENPPSYLAQNIKFIKNDIRNREILLDAIKNMDAIYNLAAFVGIGQSMYDIEKYVDANTRGTANLLDIMVNEPNNVKKLIVASSNSTYGEGLYYCENCDEKLNPKIRDEKQLSNQKWEIFCPRCSQIATPIPTDENKLQDSNSIYGLTKMDQEKMSLLIGDLYGINTTALRFFNVYGSRQSLSNPYTGVCSIFSNSLLNGHSPIIFEDGLQSRDFIHVNDICQALILSMNHQNAKNEVFNVGTGVPITILHISEILANYINPEIKPNVTNKFRLGDIRHCFADISKIKSKLGFKPQISFNEGIKELVEWVKLQNKVKDQSVVATDELKQRGLLK